jgi:hypothetical protein
MNLTGNNHISSLCQDWLDAKKKLARYKKIEESCKNDLINALNKNKTDVIICGQFEINRKVIKGSAGREITFDDVGTFTGVRKQAISITINEIED